MSDISISRLNRKARNIRRSREPVEMTVDWLRGMYSDLASELAGRRQAWKDAGLSEREAEVAALREIGFTNRAIAIMLDLSPSTVDEYQQRGEEKYI